MIRRFCLIIFCAMFFVMQNCSAEQLIATTATENTPWSLSVVKADDGKYYFLVLNTQTEQFALIQYSRENYNFYMKDSPHIFIMAVKDSPKNIDTDLGEWHEGFHLLPVYALYNYTNGRVELESYLSSCNGLSASHYQGRIQSPYHIKLAEIFLTHMPALHRVVEHDKIILP